jgi:hypothetical protein
MPAAGSVRRHGGCSPQGVLTDLLWRRPRRSSHSSPLDGLLLELLPLLPLPEPCERCRMPPVRCGLRLLEWRALPML